MIRWCVRAILYLGGWVIELTQRLQDRLTHVVQKPEYLRRGACGSCGCCCRAVGIEVPAWMLRFAWCERAFVVWHRYRYNFHALGRLGNMLVYECAHLNDNNRCSIYRWRPRLCREFPKEELFGRPALHGPCGYYFVKRNASKFAQELRRQEKEST